MIRTALTLSISGQDAQNCSFLANGTHLGLLSSAAQNTHVQTSHRPFQLIVALRAEDAASGASIGRQRQQITAWQDFLQLMAHHRSSELNSLIQKYHLQADWLICLDEYRLQAWLTPEAGFYLLRGQELRRLRPTTPRETTQAAAAAAAEARPEGRLDGRQYYALNIRGSDHVFLLPPNLLNYFSSGEAASILLGLRQLPAKMSDLFNTARLRGFGEDCTWLALQVLRQEEDQLPDAEHGRFWRQVWTGLSARSREAENPESGSDSVSLDGRDDSAGEAAEVNRRMARPGRRLAILLGIGMAALVLLFLLGRFVIWPAGEPTATTLQTTTVQTTRATTAKPTPTPTVAPTTTAPLPNLVVSARQLNLREQPDRNSKLLTTLKNGDQLYKMAEPDGDWVKVQTMDGLVGYVYAD